MAENVEIPGDTLERLKSTPTGYITDALNKLGLAGSVASIRPARGFEDTRLVGPALTIEVKLASEFDGKGLSPYEIYAAAIPGQISVIAGLGLEKIFAGDNQATMAKNHGVAGMVIDGGARDIADIRALGLPLWYKGSQTSRLEPQTVISAANVPVKLGDVVVNAGDVVVADEDGVVVIPRDALSATLEQIEAVSQIEAEMSRLLARRAPLSEISATLAKKSARAT